MNVVLKCVITGENECNTMFLSAIEETAGMISFVSRNVNVNKLPLCLRSCEAFTNLEDIVEWVVNRKISHDLMVARFAKEKSHTGALEIQPGSYLLDHYKILNQIGRGGMLQFTSLMTNFEISL